MVSIQEAAASVSQSARHQWDNISRRESDQQASPRGFRDSLDSLLRTLFAPCAGADIGGIPKDEVFDYRPSKSAPKSPRSTTTKQSKQSAATQATIPFEVSASSSSSLSLSRSSPVPAVPTTPHQKDALSKLRQLGAQHQLACGVHGERLADVARPPSPEKQTSPDLIDFDDGISAISSQTLEEMEKRHRQNNGTMPKVAGALKEKLNSPIRENVPWQSRETEFKPFIASEDLPLPVDVSRDASFSTRKTNATEESFQRFMQHEAQYWDGEVKNDRRSRAERPSLEDRAKKLREMSRSRSRSDGTGSSLKSKSSLRSTGHPHDTVPVYSSDLFGNKNTIPRSSSTSKKGFVRGSFDRSDPFAALDYGEI